MGTGIPPSPLFLRGTMLNITNTTRINTHLVESFIYFIYKYVPFVESKKIKYNLKPNTEKNVTTGHTYIYANNHVDIVLDVSSDRYSPDNTVPVVTSNGNCIRVPYGGKRSPLLEHRSYEDLILCYLAHELYHCHQMQNRKPKYEYQCEKFSEVVQRAFYEGGGLGVFGFSPMEGMRCEDWSGSPKL